MRAISIGVVVCTVGAVGTVAVRAATPDITGKVMSPDGQTPATGVAVVALDASQNVVGSPSVTDPTGAFSLSVPDGADYTVEADPPDPNPSAWVMNEQKVSVPAGGTVADLALAMLAPTLDGKITDSQGNPVHDAGVTAYPMSSTGPTTPAFAATDSQGEYGLNLPPGSYTLSVGPPQTNTESLVPATLSVEVTATGITTKDVTLSSANVTGTVEAPDGSPIANSSVAALDSSTHQPIQGVYAVSGSDGSFGLELPSGSYELVASPPSDDVAGWAQGTLDVTVGSGAVTAQVIKLAVPTLTGRVLSPDGSAPLPKAVVSATMAPSGASGAGSTPTPPETATAASNGVYGLDLPAGTYNVTVYPPTNSQGWVSATSTVTVPATNPTDLRAAQADVTGFVYAPDGATPVENAEITVLDGSGNPVDATGTTGPDGSYGLLLPPGNYTLTAAAPPGASNYQPGTVSISIAQGQSLTGQNITLLAANVTGTLTQADGTTPAVGSIYAFDTGAGHWVSSEPTQTSPTGAFGLRLPAGTYRLVGIGYPAGGAGSSPAEAVSQPFTVGADPATVKLSLAAPVPPAFQLGQITMGTAPGGPDGSSGEASMSADGSRVAFVSQASNLVPNEDLGGGSGVFLYTPATASTTLVAPGSDVALSRSGRWLSFVSSDPTLLGGTGGVGVFIEDLSSAKPVPVRVDQFQAAAGAPAALQMAFSGTRPSVSDDGRWVAFAGSDTSGAGAVFLADVAGSTLTELTDPGGSGMLYSPSVSSSGTDALVDFVASAPAAAAGAGSSYALDQYSTAASATTKLADLGTSQEAPTFSTSADGSTIAYTVFEAGGAETVHLMSAGKDATLPIFDGFGLAPGSLVHSMGLDAAGDILYFDAPSGEAGPYSGDSEVWAYHVADQTTHLVTAGGDGSPLAYPSQVEAVSGDGTSAVLSSYGGGLSFSVQNLYLAVPRTATAPSWPAGATLTVTQIGSQIATLTWTSVVDPFLGGYRVFANGQQVADVPANTTTTTLTGLTPATNYTFQVQAGGTDGIWTSDGPETTATTSSPSQGASQVASAQLQPDGTVKVSWPAAAGSPTYRVYRTVGTEAPVALHPDTTDTTFTDVPPASSSVSYSVSTVDQNGNPTPYAVSQPVTTPALALSSVSYTADILVNNVVKPNSDLTIKAVGSPSRAVTATVTYLQASPPSPALHPALDPRVALPRDAASGPLPSTQTALVTLSEDPADPGNYSGKLTLPADAIQVTAITAAVTDGSGSTVTASATGLPLLVAGTLSVAITAPDASLTGGQLQIGSPSTMFYDSVPVTGGGTQTLLVPAAADYYVVLTDGSGREAAWTSGITVASGQTTPVALTATFPATVNATVSAPGSGGSSTGVQDVPVYVTDANSGAYLGQGWTDSAGTVAIDGLVSGTAVKVAAQPGSDQPYQQDVAAVTETLVPGSNSAAFTLTPLATGSLHGTVMNAYGDPEPAGTVYVNEQTTDGRSWSYTAHTDANGKYSVALLAGQATVSIGSPDGWDSDAKVAVDPGADVEHDVNLQQDLPYNLTVNLYTHGLDGTKTGPISLDWRTAVHFGMHIDTADASFGFWSFSETNNQAQIEGHSGEVVKACANGEQAQLSPVEVCSPVTLGSDQNPSVNIDLYAVPLISGTLLDPTGQPLQADWSASVLDTSANPPTVVAQQGGSGSDLEVPVSNAGNTSDSYLLSVSSGELSADVPVTVSSGEKTTLGNVSLRSARWFSSDSVPDDNAVVPTPAQAMPGDRVQFRAQFKNNGSAVTGAVATIEQPAGATLVPGSVVLDGNPVTPQVAGDGSLTVPVGDLAGGAGGVLSYSVDLSSAAAPTSTVGSLVKLAFTADGAPQVESLQSGSVAIAGVTLEAPTQINQLTLTASGRAPAASPISVFDGSTLLATTTSSPGGYWQAPLSLTDFSGPHWYDLRAEATYKGQTLRSDDTPVHFDGSQPTVTQVSIWQTDPQNPNARKFSWNPGNGLAHFPFVWVPGQAFNIQATFSDPSRVNNVVLYLGSQSATAVKQPDGSFLAQLPPPSCLQNFSGPDCVWPSISDGHIAITFDTVPKPLDLGTVTAPTMPQIRGQLPPGFNDFTTPTVVQDPNTPNTVDISTSFPSLGTGGVSATATVSITQADYTPTAADQSAVQSSGVPFYGVSVTTDPSTGTVSYSGYVPMNQLSPAAARAVRAAVAPRLPSAGQFAKFAFTGAFGEGEGKTSPWNLFTTGVNLKQGLFGTNYGALMAMQNEAVGCDNFDQLMSQISAANTAMLVMDTTSVVTGAFVDFTGAAIATALLPETFGVGTVVAAGATFAAGQAVNAGFNAIENSVIAPLQKQVDSCPRTKGGTTTVNIGPGSGSHSGAPAGAQGLGDATGIEDPSGFVYEGVPSNRLSGVTTTLLYSQDQNGPWSVWNADWYGQQNPLTTDTEGRYAWNVPDGWWKVQFSAPGYQTAFSDPMQVPPPRYGVNVGLVSLAAPTLSSAQANPDGTISAMFSQYMQTSTVTSSEMTVTDGSGNPVAGSVAPVGAQTDPSGRSLATTFRFTPSGTLPSGTLSLTAGPTALNYASRPLAAAATAKVVAATTPQPPVSGGSTTVGVGPAPSQAVTPGGTVLSDPGSPSPGTPLVVALKSPAGGDVTFSKAGAIDVPAGYEPVPTSVVITAPSGSSDAPLTLTFSLDTSVLPSSFDINQLTVFRDGQAVADCSTTGPADPNPCVSSRSAGPPAQITVLSSHASTWGFGIDRVDRLAGADRVGTSVAVSKAEFPADHTASSAVLARADDYADALAGVPLARAEHGPLLLVGSSSSQQNAALSEVGRVVPSGATVYVLGGTRAVPASVESALDQAGYKVVRLAGADRFATAVAVAHALGDPTTVLLATGTNFPDALAGGAAAADSGAALLLTDGSSLPAATRAYLGGRPQDAVYALGGPAAAADPSATPVVGADRYATAAMVAGRFYPAPNGVALASGTDFPDALSGGVMAAMRGWPVLLSDPSGLTPAADSYVKGTPSVSAADVFGGTAAMSETAAGQLTTDLH